MRLTVGGPHHQAVPYRLTRLTRVASYPVWQELLWKDANITTLEARALLGEARASGLEAELGRCTHTCLPLRGIQAWKADQGPVNEMTT